MKKKEKTQEEQDFEYKLIKEKAAEISKQLQDFEDAFWEDEPLTDEEQFNQFY